MQSFSSFLLETFDVLDPDQHEYHHKARQNVVGLLKDRCETSGIHINRDLIDKFDQKTTVRRLAGDDGFGWSTEGRTLLVPTKEKYHEQVAARGTRDTNHYWMSGIMHEHGHAEHYSMHPDDFRAFTGNVIGAAQDDFKKIKYSHTDLRKGMNNLYSVTRSTTSTYGFSDSYHAASLLGHTDLESARRGQKQIGTDHGADYYWPKHDYYGMHESDKTMPIRYKLTPHARMAGEIVANITGSLAADHPTTHRLLSNVLLHEHFPQTVDLVKQWHSRL